MRSWMLLFGVMTAACDVEGDRVGFSNGPGDGGTSGVDATGDGPLVRLDALPVRDTGPVIINEDAACAMTTSNGLRRPMNLLLVLDRSGSMDEPRGAAVTKWTAAVAAIRSLVTRLDDDTRVGITFFPSASDSGSAAGYARPVVNVGPLRMTRASILSQIASARPSGNTPMTCAIEGSMQYYRGVTLDGSHNLVLITDGLPTEECTMAELCFPNPLDIPGTLACLQRTESVRTNAVRVQVALGQRAMPPVRTFVAGTPEASDTFLSDLAVTGGSPRTADCRAAQNCHYSLRLGSFESDLSMAFAEIQGRALSCEFDLDVDPARVDPTRVNVNYQGTGDTSQRLVPRDVDHRDGWDYSAGMRSVVLYGPTCDRVRTDPMARVRILFGCPTVTPG